jgi:hypothetical protein
MEGFANSENAEAVYLYKMYFGIESVVEEKPLNKTSTFKGDYEYLTNGFVSDFYIEMLKGQHKDFGVNEKGIYLINNDPQTIENVRQLASEDLKQYSIISKQLPNLSDNTTNQIENKRDNAINNPQTIEKYQGDLFKLNEDEVIIKNKTDEFVKIGNDIYENIAKMGELNHFIKLDRNNSEYFAVNLQTKESNVNINDYKYLQESTDTFISAKKYLKNENLTEFNC